MSRDSEGFDRSSPDSPMPVRFRACRVAVTLFARQSKWLGAVDCLHNRVSFLPLLTSHLNYKLDQEHVTGSVSRRAAVGFAAI